MSDVVPATLLLADPRGKRHYLPVMCPYGDHHHLHLLAVDADRDEPIVRRPRCDPRRPYLIEVVETLPAAAVRHVA